MTLTELSYIVALAQEQHFGRAAERCLQTSGAGTKRAAYDVAPSQPT
jgi:DNA-binding transcriptional LysR family regulator